MLLSIITKMAESDTDIISWLQSQLPVTNEAVIAKIQRFLKAISISPIHTKFLQSLAYQGIPEEMKSLRPLIWKILLYYLPNDTAEWPETLRMNRENYETIRNELLIKP